MCLSRALCPATLALALALSSESSGQSTVDRLISASAKAIQDSAIVVDTHEDTPLRFLDENYDIGSVDPIDHDYISLAKAHAGNLTGEFFSIFVYPPENKLHFTTRALELIDSVYEQAAQHPDRMMMAFSSEDIERAHQVHKLAALMGVEGGHAIENDIRVLRNFYRLGVRYMTLTWSTSNEWADSSGDIDDAKVEHHNGLTDFGKQVVLEMNRLGMMVDISHVSDKTFWDAIAVAKAPVIASHSSARALTDSPRNMTDEMLRAVAKNGGVVCVNFVGYFVDESFARASERQHQSMTAAVRDYAAKQNTAGHPLTPEDSQRFALEWLNRNPIARAPLRSLIDHIDHVARVAGVDHVGLGSDFDGRNFFPEGIDTAADICPRLRRHCWIGDTAPTTFTRFSAEMC